MGDKAKPSLAVVIGGAKPSDHSEPDGDESKGKLAEHILEAIADKDAGALAKAICALVDAHGASDDDADDYGSDEEE